MGDELKIMIVGDGVGGGAGGAGRVAGGGNSTLKGISNFLTGGLGAVIGGAIGAAFGAPALGASIGKAVVSFIVSNVVALGLASFVATGVTLAASIVFGPFIGQAIGWMSFILSFLTGMGMMYIIKKAMDNSEMYSMMKKSLSGGLGAILDSIIGVGYLFTQWLRSKLPEGLIAFLDDPIPFLKTGITSAWEGAMEGLKGHFSLETIFKEVDFHTWALDFVLFPITSVLSGFSWSVTDGITFDWTTVAISIEAGYDEYIKPALKGIQKFSEMLGFDVIDVPEDLISLPEKMTLNLHGDLTVDKINVREAAEKLGQEEGWEVTPGTSLWDTDIYPDEDTNTG